MTAAAGGIEYRDSVAGISEDMLVGFFEGWPKPPSSATLLAILSNATYRMLAVEQSSGHVVGFVTALSDGILTAYIPLLEVLPKFRAGGIGTELVRLLLSAMPRLYMVDVVCDVERRPFYERFGMQPASAMISRSYDLQAGHAPARMSDH